MIRRPPRSTRTDTLFPYTTLFRSRVSYNPETGIFVWVSSPRPGWAGRRAGFVKNKGYRVLAIDEVRFLEHRPAWFLMTGKWPPGEVDHRNGARDDNRWCNLRKATKAQNQANDRRRSNNPSGVKGVTRNKARKKWVATIKAGGQRMSRESEEQTSELQPK